MKTALALILGVAILYGHVQEAVSQIPQACSDAASLQNLTCCPITSNGVCGVDAGRGECVSLQLPNHDMQSTNVRGNWPHYYTKGCQCSGNFFGYDCSRCKFGYYGNSCNQKQVLPRLSVAIFSDADWAEFNRIINMTRTYDSGYLAVLEETVPGNTTLRTAPLTIYGMFIWVHHYASKDSSAPVMLPIDYAHTAPGFYTWHRYLGLWLEWSIQGMLQEQGETDYHTFRLPYWDWRREVQLSTVGLSVEDLFTFNRLGATRNVSGSARVYGDLYGSGWETMCWRKLGQICDPTEGTGQLQRCPYTGTNPCHSSNPDWPVNQTLVDALNVSNYDALPYNRFTLSGFRAFADLSFGAVPYDECSTDRQCQCIPGADPTCASRNPQQDFTLKSGMHLLGHIIIGQGDFNFRLNNDIQTIGTFEDVAASPNDPVFILHHNMLDCIWIEWLRRHPDAEYPRSVQTIGHARNGSLVPFFPLITHNEVFMPTEEFGYQCFFSDFESGSNVAASISVIAVLTASLFGLAFNLF